MTVRISPLLGAAAVASAVLAGGAGATERSAPANDNFANAYTLTGYESQGRGTNVGATGQPGEPGGHEVLNTVWWKWRSPATGRATFDTHGSALDDAYLCVYYGASLATLTQLGCDDDDGIGLDSALRADVVRGRVYYIQVDGAFAKVGGLVVRARFPRCNGVTATVDLTVETQHASNADDIIVGTDGPDRIDGLDGNDTICGFGGDDLIGAGPGDDFVVPGPGNDSVNGGVGVDTLSYRDLRSAGSRVTFDLAVTTPQSTVSSGTDRAVVFENLHGGAGNDVLKGNASDNAILGGAGDDDLAGAGGNDTLDGGGGVDRCTGGPGSDTWTACETVIGFP